jgi:hypothetical protein
VDLGAESVANNQNDPFSAKKVLKELPRNDWAGVFFHANQNSGTFRMRFHRTNASSISTSS